MPWVADTARRTRLRTADSAGMQGVGWQRLPGMKVCVCVVGDVTQVLVKGQPCGRWDAEGLGSAAAGRHVSMCGVGGWGMLGDVSSRSRRPSQWYQQRRHADA
jgi:hypothetical protein